MNPRDFFFAYFLMSKNIGIGIDNYSGRNLQENSNVTSKICGIQIIEIWTC
jgi:hypothetical protein